MGIVLEVAIEVPVLGPFAAAVEVDFVAELEGDETGADEALNASRFDGCAFRSSGSEVEAVDELPAGGLEEACEVLDGCGSDDGVAPLAALASTRIHSK